MTLQRREVDMKLACDAKADALLVRVSEKKIVGSEEPRSGLVRDVDEKGHIVAVDLPNARDQLAPKAIADLLAAE
jgi:uncharacterized protein YuzE